MKAYTNGPNKYSVDEVLERPTGYPKVGGSNHRSGVFPPKISGPPAVVCRT